MAGQPSNDSWLTFMLPTEDRHALRQLAARQDRSMSAVLRELVSVALEPTSWEIEPEDQPTNVFVARARQL